MNEIKSTGDLTNYVHFGTYTGGYTCPHCGAWVFYNQPHSCYPQFPSYSPDYSPYMTWQPNYIQPLIEIKDSLERIIELLSRE